MILILGGTTEGRHAVKVCDEASKPYYYSTKGDIQEVECIHGIRLTGALDEKAMAEFCSANGIRLIIDAAHPFAVVLHETIARVSERLDIPVVRYERNYPRHEDDLIWCDTYQDAIDYLNRNNIDNLLALTGVNTIAKLKEYWQNHNCWFRILDRDESREVASKSDFPTSKILYYKQGEPEEPLYKELNPQAIITKESGESGGFSDKIDAARQLNIPVLVVKRPTLSPNFISIYGENGLRKAIEKLVDGFFELRTGYTTGTCATAATKAALTALLEQSDNINEVSITLPNGEWVMIPISSITYNKTIASATVIKDAGDDPDVTHGTEIVSTVELDIEKRGVHFLKGKGVGTVTLPGLGLEIGGPAINAMPRKMIKREVFKVFRHLQDKLPNNNLKTGVNVTISVPKGEELALKTFNPKIGIVGGISIIGTSGVVKPFSADAFVRAIRREMQVAQALKCKQIVINSGAKSEKYVKQLYPDLPSQAFIHYGNFIGETIKLASDLNVKYLTMGIMIGKAVKLAEGSLDTHSKKVVMNKDFLKGIASEAKCSQEIIDSIEDITLARQLWTLVPNDKSDFFSLLIEKCHTVCAPLLPNGELTILLIDEEGNIIK